MASKLRLWLVVEGRTVDGTTEWEVVSAHDNDSDDCSVRYNELKGDKMLLLWTMLHGISVWRISHGKTVYGNELDNPQLPWEVIPLNPRVKLFSRVYETIVKFIKHD